MGKKYWRYDILLTPSKTLWEKYEELYKLIYRKNSYKNPVEKIGENMTVYYWYCLLDNSHEKPFQGKIMNELWGQYVSLIFPTKTPMGKIENMTHFLYWYCLVKNLLWETFVRKTHRGKRVQYDVWTGYNPGKDSPWTLQLSKSLNTNSMKYGCRYGLSEWICKMIARLLWQDVYFPIWR